METLKLTYVNRKQVETKYGIKPQLVIKADEYGDEYLSTFNVKGTEGWEPGVEVQVEVTKNGDFFNFKPVGVPLSTSKPSSDLEKRVEKLESAVFGQEKEASVQPQHDDF